MQIRKGRDRRGHAFLSALVLAVLLIGMVATPVAAERERSWVLDKDGNPLTAPVAYVFDIDIDGLYKESGTFRNPSDMFLDHEGYIWIADTGNNRLVKFTQDGKYLNEYGKELGPAKLNQPEGVFITLNGNIWVADRGNSRVVELTKEGKFIRDYPKPASKLLAADQVYQPSKIVIDRRGQIYVLNGGGDYRGMFLLDGQGVFRGFFAANRLPFNVIRLFIQWVTTEAQKRQISKILPTHHANMHLDERGFIWSVSPLGTDEQIKKLSAVGINVYKRGFSYGEEVHRGAQLVKAQFVDVTVDHQEIVSALDFNSGRVYQYDQLGNLLAIFGGRGPQRGKFELPASITADRKGRLYVLDANRNNIQRFRPTGYAQMVHEASKLYYDGYYPESADLWREVLRRNSNFEFGHVGVAKSYYKLGDYLASMNEYAVARDTEGYSLAFGEYRHSFLRENFGWVMPLVILVMWLGWTLLSRSVKRIMALNLEVEDDLL